jgi:hypothetical protein
LPAAAVVIVLAGDSSEHVQQHAVDGLEHTRGKLVTRLASHGPRRWQVERNHFDASGHDLAFEPLLQ